MPDKKPAPAVPDLHLDWKRLFEALSLPALLLNQDHEIVMANQEALRLLGIPLSELVGKKCYKVLHDLDFPIFTCPFSSLKESPKQNLAIAEIPITGGDYLVSCSLVDSGDGEMLCLHLMTEITHIKELQRIRDGAPSIYKDLVENANDIIQILDRDGHFLYVNKAWKKTLGYSDEDLKTLRIFDIIHPDCKLKCHDMLDQVMSGTPLYGIEVQFKTKNGGKIIVEGSCNCRFKDGNPVSTRGIFRDITRRKVAETALKELMKRHELILNSIGEGILGIDVHGRLTFVNPVAAKMLGYEPKEMVGKFLHRLIHHTNIDGAAYREQDCPIHATIQRGITMANRRDLFWRKDGSGFPVEFTCTPIMDDGKVTGAVVAFRDVSDRVKAEEERQRMQAQLLQAQKMEAIGTLAAGVAHDFNNLLTAIQGYTEVAMMKLGADHRAKRDLDYVLTATSKAANLVRQLLLFSRKQPMDTAVVNLNELIEGLLKMLKRIIGEDVEIVTRLDPDLFPMRADPGQIEQIVMNLAVNARDAMPDGGTLTIETHSVSLSKETADLITHARPGKYVRITITDTGHGMDEETLSHIFEPFFTTKGPTHGTGLGLSVVYGIVNQHGGWINVYSRLGDGTTFRIYFPAEELQSTPPSVRDKMDELPRGQGELILVVEDDPMVLTIAKEGLTTFGYKVITADTIAKAKKILNSGDFKPDMVFSDVILPDGNGVQLVKLIQEKWPSMPLLLASGYTDEKTGVAIAHVFQFPFLKKPYSVADLLHKVKEIFSSHSSGEKHNGENGGS